MVCVCVCEYVTSCWGQLCLAIAPKVEQWVIAKRAQYGRTSLLVCLHTAYDPSGLWGIVFCSLPIWDELITEVSGCLLNVAAAGESSASQSQRCTDELADSDDDDDDDDTAAGETNWRHMTCESSLSIVLKLYLHVYWWLRFCDNKL